MSLSRRKLAPTRSVCPICGRPAVEESQFCKPHQRARLQLESAFAIWQRAYGTELNRKTFFQRLLQLEETGEKVRDLIKFLMESDRN